MKNKRVGALMYTNKENKEIGFFGYGEYVDRSVPNEAAGGTLAEMARDLGMTNPEILLDNGKTVWGCECWWGNEEEVKEKIHKAKQNGFTILDLDIDEERRKVGETP